MTDEPIEDTRRDFLKLATMAGGAAIAANSARPLYAQLSGASGGTYDYVVAGGGHNGLICAAYLAMAGFDVAVLEAKPEAGGNTATENCTGTSMLHEPCCNTPGGLHGSPVYRELDMEGWGVEYAPLSRLDGMVRLSQFYDGETLPMWLDPERTAAEIARFSKRDAQTYLTLMNEDGPPLGSHRRTPIGYGPTIEEMCATHPRGATFLKRRRQRCVDTVKEYYEDEHRHRHRRWRRRHVRPAASWE
jgi:phytoene dehydrogenase-like protein